MDIQEWQSQYTLHAWARRCDPVDIDRAHDMFGSLYLSKDPKGLIAGLEGLERRTVQAISFRGFPEIECRGCNLYKPL